MEMKEIALRKFVKPDPTDMKAKIDKLRKDHSKLVKGKFEFVEAQGGWLEFTYRFFPEDLLMTYKFTHGEVCEIPMGLVKHLNNTVKKIRTFPRDLTQNVRGVPSTSETQSRVRFTPVDMF